MLELLSELKRLNIKIKLVDDNLKIIGVNGKLPQDLVDKLKREKTNLIEYLKNGVKAKNWMLTPSDFTYKGLSIEEVDSLKNKFDIEDVYRLTPMQEGMLFHTILDPNSSAYFEQISYRMRGDLNVDLIRRCLNELFKRYEVLRTVFIHEDFGNPLQVVLINRECGFVFEDISNLSLENQVQYINDQKTKDRKHGFKLDRDVLMRVLLFQLGENEYELIWSHHHILMDGWCVSIVNNDFFQIYNSLLNCNKIHLPITTPFREYIKWLEKVDKKQSLDYWKDYLSGYEEPVSLPHTIKANGVFTKRRESLSFSIEVASKLRRIATENSVTPNIFLQSAWSIVLGKYGSKEDIVFGCVVSGRPSEIQGVETIVGLFINNIPVRVRYSIDEPFSSLLRRVQVSSIDSAPHHYISLAEIQSQSVLRQNLIESIYVFENYPIEERIENIEDGNEYDRLKLKISNVDIYEQTNYDLVISVILNAGLVIKLDYNSNVYDPNMIARLKMHLENAIIEVVDNPEVKISHINILSEEDIHQQLIDYNDTKVDFPKNKTVLDLINEQILRNPKETAVLCKTHTLTYEDLEQRSHQLAYKLNKCGVGRNVLVGILLDPSEYLIISILGIFKSGGAFVAIDQSYPEHRKKYIIENSNIKVILSTGELISSNKEILQNIPNLNLVDVSAIEPESEIDTLKFTYPTPTDLAYVLYTSGSTGVPKGVMIEHGSLLNYLSWANKEYIRGEYCPMALFTSISFDLTITSIFLPLISGNSLKVYLQEEQELLVQRVLSDGHAKVIKLTPAHLRVLCETNNEFIGIKRLIVGGEQLNEELAKKAFEKGKGTMEIYNEYGPTEATVGCVFYKYNYAESGQRKSVLIGKPVSNSVIYILDSHLKLLPKGSPGEIYIGGSQLFRGYLSSVDQTSQNLFISPFKQGEYIYKTGDFAKWMADGNIEFLGRRDDQVKIRGFRIELEEIESQLAKYESLSSCAVMAKERNGEKYLVAYYLSDKEQSDLEMREYLIKRLPEYMVPSFYVHMENLPLTPNGKIDRRALPDPEIKVCSDFRPPTNEVEERLVEIWAEVLGIDKIGIRDNFFMLGGDSIKLIQVSARLRKYGLKLSLNDLFLNPTIESLSPYLQKIERESYQGLVTGNIPFTPIQKEFFLSEKKKKHHFNQSVMLYSKEGFDQSIIKAVFDRIQEHHDILRTRFIKNENKELEQFNSNLLNPLNLEVYDLIGEEQVREKVEELANKLQSSIDLEKGPLMHLGLFKLDDGDHLLIIIHHLIVDGVSWRILFEDIHTLFEGIKLGKKVELPLKTDSFKYWSDELLKYSNSESFLKEKAYWQKLELNSIPKIEKDIEGIKFGSNFRKLSVCLDKEKTNQLLKEVNQAYGTQINDILLSGLALSLKECFGLNKVLIAMEGHGREELPIDVDVSRTIGWFTSKFPVIFDLSQAHDFSGLIKEIKETLHRIPHKGIGYGILKYLTTKEKKEGVKFILSPQICFNYLGQFDSDINNKSFNMSNLPKGNEMNPEIERDFELDFVGIIVNEQLTLSVTYNSEQYYEETIKRLMNNLKSSMEDLISHCIYKEIAEVTPSDFEYKNISLTDFENLFA